MKSHAHIVSTLSKLLNRSGRRHGSNHSVHASLESLEGRTLRSVTPLLAASVECAGNVYNQRALISEPMLISAPTVISAPTAIAAPTLIAAPSAHEQVAIELYTDLLHRTADAGGLAYWTGCLDSGTLSYANVATAFTASREYHSSLVAGLYTRFLGRDATTAELNSAADRLDQGADLRDVATDILSSNEFYNLQGGNNAAFVGALYQSVLGRAADPSGSSHWQGVIAGQGRRAAVSGITGSVENLDGVTRSLYQAFLRRDVDAGGEAYWVGALSQGLTECGLAAAITSSGEYLNLATGVPAPTGLTVAPAGTSINLSWTNNAQGATGFVILRSNDSHAYTVVANTDGGSLSFVDTTATPGQTYYYEVQAMAGDKASVESNAASTLIPPPGIVAVTTRFGNELVVTSTGTSNAITISENQAILTIVADGQSYQEAAPSAGLFIYARGAGDSVTVDSSVTLRTTVESINGAASTINCTATDASIWIDDSDAYSGSGVAHRVATFAGDVSKDTGASLANPSDSGQTTVIDASLFGAGISAEDANQGSVGDCYFISSLAAFAHTNPAVVHDAAVDMGDGTYVVQFVSQGSPVFVRVSNELPAGWWNGLAFAHPGASGDLWVPVFEKAYAYFRYGQNTYDSLNGGWMGDVYNDLGVASTFVDPAGLNSASFFKLVSTALANNQVVTLATKVDAPQLVGSHAYTVMGVTLDTQGVAHYQVRNPWGMSGGTLEDNQGYATLTFAQINTNCDGLAAATA